MQVDKLHKRIKQAWNLSAFLNNSNTCFNITAGEKSTFADKEISIFSLTNFSFGERKKSRVRKIVNLYANLIAFYGQKTKQNEKSRTIIINKYVDLM